MCAVSSRFYLRILSVIITLVVSIPILRLLVPLLLLVVVVVVATCVFESFFRCLRQLLLHSIVALLLLVVIRPHFFVPFDFFREQLLLFLQILLQLGVFFIQLLELLLKRLVLGLDTLQ